MQWTKIRGIREGDPETILSIINAAAEAYRGVIPTDCFHDPYMSDIELQAEIAAGVTFIGCEIDRALVGVMGIQPVHDVALIRHAYVLPRCQKSGVGSALMTHLREQNRCQLLVGTWAAATWAIRFYERHGFQLVPEGASAQLLRVYWSVPERQIETSVVLASPALNSASAAMLVNCHKRLHIYM